MNANELEQFIETIEKRRGKPGAIAGRLGGHSGLRREEATEVRWYCFRGFPEPASLKSPAYLPALCRFLFGRINATVYPLDSKIPV
jgi:hypothetical protein